MRDSKYTNIRVFDREALNLEAANNNKVFAKLSTGGDFIGSSNEPLGESYDMEVIGDSLYAFIPRTGTIYSWKVEDIIQQRIMPRSRFPVLRSSSYVPFQRPVTRISSSYQC